MTERRQKKVIFVLIDGLADVNIPNLQGKTTLQAAHTPAMDAIAAGGLNGLLDSVEPGLGCGSDTAHMSIFGYDPRKYYRGRGAFEVMGAGLAMEPGDIAFKSNFATVDDRNGPPDFDKSPPVVSKRRVDRNFPSWGLELCPYLDGLSLPSFPDVSVGVKYATEHRCGVRLRGVGLTDTISGTDPLKDKLPLRVSKPLTESEQSTKTAQVVNELVKVMYEKLSKHPLNIQRVAEGKPAANMVLLRGPGERISVTPFPELHNMKGFMIAPTCIIAGMGMSIGLDIIIAPGATGDYHTDFSSKQKTAIKAIQNGYNFGFIHTKAVDDAGHDKDIEKKVHFLQEIDKMIGAVLLDLHELSSQNETEFVVVVTGDHSTPVLTGDHSCEPVPFAISDAEQALKPDTVRLFDELSAARGGLGRFPGQEVMTIIKKFAGVPASPRPGRQ